MQRKEEYDQKLARQEEEFKRIQESLSPTLSKAISAERKATEQSFKDADLAQLNFKLSLADQKALAKKQEKIESLKKACADLLDPDEIKDDSLESLVQKINLTQSKKSATATYQKKFIVELVEKYKKDDFLRFEKGELHLTNEVKNISKEFQKLSKDVLEKEIEAKQKIDSAEKALHALEKDIAAMKDQAYKNIHGQLLFIQCASRAISEPLSLEPPDNESMQSTLERIKRSVDREFSAKNTPSSKDMKQQVRFKLHEGLKHLHDKPLDIRLVSQELDTTFRKVPWSEKENFQAQIELGVFQRISAVFAKAAKHGGFDSPFPHHLPTREEVVSLLSLMYSGMERLENKDPNLPFFAEINKGLALMVQDEFTKKLLQDAGVLGVQEKNHMRLQTSTKAAVKSGQFSHPPSEIKKPKNADLIKCIRDSMPAKSIRENSSFLIPICRLLDNEKLTPVDKLQRLRRDLQSSPAEEDNEGKQFKDRLQDALRGYDPLIENSANQSVQTVIEKIQQKSPRGQSHKALRS